MADDRSYVGLFTVYWGPTKLFVPLLGPKRAADGMEGREGQAVEPNIMPQKTSIRISIGESIQWKIRDSLLGKSQASTIKMVLPWINSKTFLDKTNS